MSNKLRINEILENYYLPVKIRKGNWSSDFYVVIDSAKNGEAICTAYKGGVKYSDKQYKYSLNTEVFLLSGQQKNASSPTQKDKFSKTTPEKPPLTEETYNYGLDFYDADARAKEYEPDHFIHLSDRESIIDSYSDAIISDNEDNSYISTCKSHCIARMDVDIAFMPWDHKFCRHHYAKLYISDKTVGRMELLAHQTVWQVEAGIYKRIPPKEFHSGYNYDIYYDSGLVLDWRSPLADLYYAENKTSYLSKTTFEYEHDLLLKRRFQNGHGKNLFISGKIQADDGTTYDEYLISILESRRNEDGFRDIIRTIQSNQNEIIRKDKDINIIVQGCAGSGKTMILLHRLSVISYNNPEISPSMYEIVTPNKMFDIQISDLAKRLDLKNVKRRTPEELYEDIITGYSADYVPSDFVFPDSKAQNEIVEYVYSDSFENEIANVCNLIKAAIIKKKIIALQIPELNKVSTTLNLKVNLPIIDNADEDSKIKSLLAYKDKISERIKLLNSYSQKIVALNNLIEKDREKTRKLFLSDGVLNSAGFTDSDIVWFNTYLREKQNDLKTLIEIVGGTSAEVLFSSSKIRIGKDTKIIDIIEDLNTLRITSSEFEDAFISRRFLDEKEFETSFENKKDQIKQEAEKQGFNADIVCNGRAKIVNALQLIENIEKVFLEIESEFMPEKIFGPIYSKIILDAFPEIDASITYRHTLFAHVLFYWYYTGKKKLASIRTATGKYIFIDEAQDFSRSELMLLKTIMQDDTVFNLYGDENQIIKPYSIQKWSDISPVFNAEIEHLCENYRNTISITSFCNKKLGHNDTAIGIIGEPVDNISLSEAINRIKTNQSKEERTAFIVSNINSNSSKTVISALSEYLSINEISSSNTVFLSLEMAKGLEFDTVYVLDEGFSKNGFYIACTRALFKLIIVSPD